MKQLLAITVGVLALMLAAAPAQAQPQYPNGYYGQPQNFHTVLSPDDQKKFDEEYAKWVDSQRKNDRDDIAEHANKMQQIMSRYNIPTNVSFDQIATNSGAGMPAYQGTYPAQNPNAAPYPAYAQTRLSPDDQRRFDEEYQKWMNSQRKNDQSDVAEHAGKMQEIMARYGIPSNVPFNAIATGGYAAAPGANPYYGVPAQRLSADDQKDFDKAYKDWMKARHKRDMDDVDKNARKMESIMARYNIPANVQFDQIASPGAYK